MLDRGDRILECFNRTTQNYWLLQPIPVRYRTSEKQFLFLLSLLMRDNERQGIFVP